MHKPVSNWNITQDKFLFQEDSNSPQVFLLRLYVDKPAYLFKFSFPESVTEGLVNTFFDFDTNKFSIPKEAVVDVEDDADSANPQYDLSE